MALMLLGLPFVVSAQNQKVTINVKDVDVQVVFKQIKEQTSLNFVYNADQLKVMKAVTLDVKERWMQPWLNCSREPLSSTSSRCSRS